MNIISMVKKINYFKKHYGKYQLEMGHEPVRPHIQLLSEAAVHMWLAKKLSHTSRQERVDVKAPLPLTTFLIFSFTYNQVFLQGFIVSYNSSRYIKPFFVCFSHFALQVQLEDFYLP